MNIVNLTNNYIINKRMSSRT